MDQLVKKHAEKIRYMVVGGTNTVLDFCLLFLFVGLGINKIPANYLSTGVAMIFSFYANKSFTFKDTNANKRRQFAQFISVTVAGMWVLQPLVIWLVTRSLDMHIANPSIQLFIAKVIATGASLVWNYLLYSRLVFKKSTKESEQ